MSEIELLPCPFCSGKVEIRQKGHSSYYGGCVNGCFISSSEYDKNVLAKQLNTRKPMEEIVKRLEEYASIWCEYNESMSKDEIAQSVLNQAKRRARLE